MNDQIAMDTERLAHLPDRKRRELQHAVRILFEEFEDAQKTKLSDKARRGRILKLVLFGSYARATGSRIGGAATCRITICWWSSTTRASPSRTRPGRRPRSVLLQELSLGGRLATPVNVIVHTYQDMNDQLAQGRPFFVDIARDGIVLHELAGFPLTETEAAHGAAAAHRGDPHFEHWFATPGYCLTQATYAIGTTNRNTRVRPASGHRALYHHCACWS